VSYEIDLNSANAEKLRGALAPFVESARRVSGRAAASTGRGRGGRAARPAGAPDTAKIRAWAKEHGFEVSERGRVPKNVLEAYEKANA